MNDNPANIDQARALLAASSRDVPPELKAFYIARARLMYDKAVAELESIRISLTAREAELERLSHG